jgi:hypothetical protein
MRFAIWRMQTAFLLGKAGPASGAGIFSRFDGPRAVRASDAGVVEVVKGVVGELPRANVLPHHLMGPVGEGVNLHQREL